MTRDVKTVTLDISLRELGALFEKDDFNIYPVAETSQVLAVPEVLRIAEERHDERVIARGLLAQADDATPARSEVLHVQRHENPEEDKRAPGQLAPSAASQARQAFRGGEAEHERDENEDCRDPERRPEGGDDSQERSGCESCAKCQADLLNLDFPQEQPQDLLLHRQWRRRPSPSNRPTFADRRRRARKSLH